MDVHELLIDYRRNNHCCVTAAFSLVASLDSRIVLMTLCVTKISSPILDMRVKSTHREKRPKVMHT